MALRRPRVTSQGVASAVVIGAVIWVTLFALHLPLILSGTTAAGGDTASHLAAPWFLRQHLGFGQPTMWYPGWYDGFPLYTYYFVLPDLFVALLSHLFNFAIVFKLATVLGSVLLPVAAYTMGRLFRAPNPIPAALAAATLPYLFDSTYTIIGGNLFSTLAGEYSFSLSMACALVTIGLFARGIRENRGRWSAAVFLSLTLAAHLLPWMWAVAMAIVMVLVEIVLSWIKVKNSSRFGRRHLRRATWFVASAGALSAGLSAWWLLPFGTSQSLANSMGYVNDDTHHWSSIFTSLGWFNTSGGMGGDVWVIVLAAMALVMSVIWLDRLGLVLSASVVFSMVAFIIDPQSALFNERVLPFWFISIFLSAGWLVGATSLRVARSGIFTYIGDALRFREPSSPGLPVVSEVTVASRSVTTTYAVGLLALVITLPGVVPSLGAHFGINVGTNRVPAWAAWNFSGYQLKAQWPEYHELVTTMGTVGTKYGCGRAFWEYNATENDFGSTMALMLLPYWTNNCIGSQEGLFFESSPTTPYHFESQSELSDKPDDPMLGVRYRPLDVRLGIRHLQLLGVRYFMAFSPNVVAQARKNHDLVEVARTSYFSDFSARWHIFLIRHSGLLTGLRKVPFVVPGISSRIGWLNANQSWWLQIHNPTVLMAESGPSNWPRVSERYFFAHRSRSAARAPLPAIHISQVRLGDQSLSFHVSRIGVPVLVKISYYSRWHATGATGPYRVSPNLMVVIPTGHDVSLVYGSTPMVTIGNWISLTTFVALLVALWRRRWWRRPHDHSLSSASRI